MEALLSSWEALAAWQALASWEALTGWVALVGWEALAGWETRLDGSRAWLALRGMDGQTYRIIQMQKTHQNGNFPTYFAIFKKAL